MSTGKVTTDHREIQQWAEDRGGKPTRVKSTADKGGGGLLRIDFPDRRGEDSLEEISWESFFDTFEERELAFLYQEETSDGHESRFSKFIDREEAQSHAQRGKPAHASQANHKGGGGASTNKRHPKPHAKV